MRSHRLLDRPVITMIRVPDWIGNRLGDYYLYFADHKGCYIRLAYADHPAGPWTVHPPGSLHVAQSHFLTEPPVTVPEQVAWFEARFQERGTPISHDALSEITTSTSPRRMSMSIGPIGRHHRNRTQLSFYPSPKPEGGKGIFGSSDRFYHLAARPDLRAG